MIVGNPIIMILKAILNWFRLRRDYIANAVDKIPPEIKNALVAWYSPVKQKLSNYEVSSLNNDQQAILAKDEVYNKLSGELQMLIQEELINSVKDKVANSPRGKELLEKQLNNIRTKKDNIIEEANRELELFKKFQIAAQANPKLTYVEFCKTINNE